MNKYQKQKENARQKAIEYQNRFDSMVYSWSEIAFYSDYFSRLAKRYGLIKEFRENAII